MLAALRLLRGEYRFGGYLHAKAIPGTSPELLQQLGYLADHMCIRDRPKPRPTPEQPVSQAQEKPAE